MIFNAIWLDMIPGKREAALTHLAKLAQIGHEDFGILSRVAVHVTNGPIYATALVARHDSLAAMHSDNAALVQSERFQSWFRQSTEFFNWPAAHTAAYQALKPATMPEGWQSNFIAVISLNIIPGNLANGRSQMTQLANHFETTYSIPTSVLHNAGGSYYTHHWVCSLDSLEQYETFNAALPADEAYGQLVKEGGDFWDYASLETAVFHYIA